MVNRKKSINFLFSEKHKKYIRACTNNMYNIAEGAVRAGKTVDNVFAFAHELKTTTDKIHLATGSTAANAKLNIGDCNGMGLEYIFRGQCKWGKYKGNDCLKIKGPDTRNKLRIVIFAGGMLANSYKKIRGNSYGMWIATEINNHHEDTIKEAFNNSIRSLCSSVAVSQFLCINSVYLLIIPVNVAIALDCAFRKLACLSQEYCISHSSVEDVSPLVSFTSSFVWSDWLLTCIIF